jgi:hypothetical protein
MELSRKICVLFLGAFLALQSVAYAANPVIVKLDRNVVQPGSVVIITGRNFVVDLKKIRIEVGGKKCMVTEATITQIMFVVSLDAKVGKSKIELSVSGKKTQFPIELKDKIEEGTNDGGAAKEDLSNTKLIVINSLTSKGADGGKTALSVTGKTQDLMDGMFLDVIVNFGKSEIVRGRVTVKDNAFKHTFEAFAGKVLPGTYTVNSQFRVSRQKYKIRKEFIKRQGKKILKTHREIKRVDFFELGSKSEAKAESAKIKKLYEGLIAQIDTVFQKLQNNYGGTSRCIYYRSGKVDEAPWKKYCFAQGLCKSDAEFEVLKKNKRYVGRGGKYLNATAWRALLTAEFGKIVNIYNKAEKISGKYITTRFPKTAEAVRDLCKLTIDLTLKRTAHMKTVSKLPATDNPREYYKVTEVPAGVVRGATYFTQLVKRCKRELDPTKMVGEPDQGQK